MAYGRREIAPSEQIKALRHARDQYVQLADRIHNDTDSTLDAAEKQLREDDARRIAKAYDRSLSNSVARLSGMERTHRSTMQPFGLWYRIGILLLVALACLLPFAYRYARDGFSNPRELATVASNRLPAISAPPASPPAIIEQNPLPEKAPKNLAADTRKPAAAPAAPAPRKIVQPRAPAAKEAAPREATNAKPAPQAVQKPPEPATISAPAPAPTVSPAPAPPVLAAPIPAPIPAPPPAPIETPAPQVAAIPPPAAAIPSAPIRPEPIVETHTLPRYPPFSAQVGEAGTTKMSVAISQQGQASDCRITQSSGSERLDIAACAHVTDHWRWKPVTRDSTAPAPRVSVTMVWNLSRPRR